MRSGLIPPHIFMILGFALIVLKQISVPHNCLTWSRLNRPMSSTGDFPGARIIGDVQAIGKGKVGQRIDRRAVGKVTGWLFGKVFK